MAEAKYYLIQGLVDLCQAALQVRQAKLAEVFCQQVQSLKLNLTISGLERPFDLSHINSRVVDQWQVTHFPCRKAQVQSVVLAGACIAWEQMLALDFVGFGIEAQWKTSPVCLCCLPLPCPADII